MRVGLVLYAYATNERCSRGIERRCRQDIAYRVITGNVVPDRATVAHGGRVGHLRRRRSPRHAIRFRPAVGQARLHSCRGLS